jgi:three-Cys-motif partner protein
MTRRDLPDDADEKWVYTDHTRAKHEILHRYLGAWLAILGRSRQGTKRRHPRLMLLDGFAGRGRYVGGEDGSPKIMFDRAVQVVEADLAEEVRIGCAEPNANNFDELAAVCAGLTHERVKITPFNETFEVAATRLADWAERQRRPVPIFVMADPFGFRGVPLDLIRRLMKIRLLEVLLTFMARDMSRFLGSPQHQGALTSFFGGDAWQECSDADERAECLLVRYRQLVRPNIADFATSFRVFEDFRRAVLYYLVHLTNSDKGMRKMKEAMVHKAGDMTFWPVTVHDPNQISLEQFATEQPPFPTLQKRLREQYAGQTMTFLELLNDDYPEDVWIEKDYRAALKAMAAADPPRVTVTHVGLTKGGKPRTRGIQEADKLEFASWTAV